MAAVSLCVAHAARIAKLDPAIVLRVLATDLQDLQRFREAVMRVA
jgi:hypothetical protein